MNRTTHEGSQQGTLCGKKWQNFYRHSYQERLTCIACAEIMAYQEDERRKAHPEFFVKKAEE